MFDRLPPVQALRAFEAAIRGDGVALARSPLVADDVAAGRLVAPFPHLRLKAERGYDLVYRAGEGDHPRTQALRAWLHEEIRAAADRTFPGSPPDTRSSR